MDLGGIDVGLDVKSICGDALKPLDDAMGPLNELQDSLTAGPAELTAKMKSVAGASIPFDALQSANKSFGEFSSVVTSAKDGDAKSLVPPAAGCIAGMWVSSIKKKLVAFSKEVEGLIEDATKKGTEIPENLSNVTKGLTSLVDKFSGDIAAVAEIPQKAIAAIQDATSSPDKLKGLGGILEEIEASVEKLVTAAKETLTSIAKCIKEEMPNVLSTIEDLGKTLNTFLSKSPSKVAGAFKAPAPFTPICGKAGEAKEKLEQALSSVTSAVDLKPVTDAVSSLKGQLDLDTSPVTKILDDFGPQLTPALAPVKDAVKQATEMIDKAMEGQAAAGAAGDALGSLGGGGAPAMPSW
jgi:ABC-type transporter Mla subunit MlaD